MKSFLQWAKDSKLDLPLVENGKRTGVKPGYPEGYVRSQYTGDYFTPISATAAVDLQNAKKTKSVTPPDNAP